MASTQELFTKNGKRYFKIRVRRGRGLPTLSENWYPPRRMVGKSHSKRIGEGCGRI